MIVPASQDPLVLARILLECIAVCAGTLPFALEHAKLKSPSYLFPTGKGLYLLHTMAADLIMGLKYPNITVSATLAMAICVSYKWLEAQFIANCSSWEVTR